MLHVGDITGLSGAALPPVDVVIGGSPCQDLSVAGKGVGLAGNRSGLFMEQLRIVKELRDEDRKRGRTDVLIRPRFMVWENVPGAFSSNRGRDFQIVLQETIRIAEPDAPDIPRPKKWPLADAYFGDGWSVAYRVFDAQFWGVAQRRRRICLVADFGGRAAPEILFIRESLSGDIEAGGTAGENFTPGIGGGAYPAVARSLAAQYDGTSYVNRGPNVVVTPSDSTFCIQGNAVDRAAKMNGSGVSPGPMFTLNAVDRHAVYDARGNGDGKTVNTITGDHANRVTDYTALVMSVHQNQNGEVRAGTVANTLSTNGNASGRNAPLVAVNCRNGTESEINGTLQAKETGYNLNTNITVRQCGIVQRLTPLECERLQGFPDGWTDIGPWTDSKGKRRECSDSARYRALGNSIALPPWKWVLKRLSAQYERDALMGSLFDGIGGFPLIWEQINGKGSCIWSSEIEEFCIAVTKRRFQ